MLASPLRVLVSMAIPVLAGLLVSCVSLEFDRMTGTTFPPQHTVNGQPASLGSRGFSRSTSPRTSASAMPNSRRWRTAIVTSRCFPRPPVPLISAIPITSTVRW